MTTGHNPTYYETEAFQRTLNQLTQEQYLPLIVDMVWLNGHGINRVFQPSSEIATQQNGGLNKQMITRRARSSRNSSNSLGDTPKGGRSSADKIKLRWDTDDPDNNDFVAVEAASTIHIFDRFGGDDQIYKVVTNAQKDVFDTIDYRTAVLMHTDRDARIWTTSSIKGAFDSNMTFASASTYDAGDTIATFSIKDGSDSSGIGVAREGVRLDFYLSSTGALLASELEIVGLSIGEDAIEVQVTEDSNVTTLDALEAEDTNDVDVYLSGSKGFGFKGSLGEIFKEEYAADNWFGGRNRAAAGSRHFIPQRTRVGQSTTPLTRRMIDNMMQQIGIRTNYQTAFNPVLVQGVRQLDRFRRDIGEEAIKTEGTVDRGNYTVGELTVGYIHPAIGGRLDLMADTYAKESRAVVVNPEDTSKHYAEFRGPFTVADWKQRPGESANGTWSKFFDLAVMENSTPWWDNILRSGCIFNTE
ncbi:MAG: hypothetical protein ACX94C_11730 [Phycisphaerales bacterium]